MEKEEKIEVLGLNNKRLNKLFQDGNIKTIADLKKMNIKELKIKENDFRELFYAMMNHGVCFDSDNESRELVKKVKRQTKMVEGMLKFFKDWGSYYTRKGYKLSDDKYKEQMQEFANALFTMTLNQIIAETIVMKFHGENEYKAVLNFVMESFKREVDKK